MVVRLNISYLAQQPPSVVNDVLYAAETELYNMANHGIPVDPVRYARYLRRREQRIQDVRRELGLE